MRIDGDVSMDIIHNGQGGGDVANILLAHNGDVNALRPWIGRDGNSYINKMAYNREGKWAPTAIRTNTPATLRKDDWILLDQAIIKAAKPRLKAVADLRAAGLTYTIPDGMAVTVLQSETMGDISDATISMDGLRKGESDRPHFDIGNLPLPIIHKDFDFSLRQVLASRRGNSPVDTSTAELASRKVAETVEKLTLGQLSAYQYGGGLIYGYTNYPGRITYTLTSPASVGWIPAVTVEQVLAMKQASHDQYHYGPWILYNSPAWDKYMDDDYSAAKGELTLRERLAKISGISESKTLDYLTGYTLLLVQKSTDVVRLVIAMEVMAMQWPSHGGLQMNFKIMCIMVPQLREDWNGNTGIVHGSV